MALYKILKNMLGRISALEKQVGIQMSSIDTLNAAEATLETTVAAIEADHAKLVSDLAAAKAANDWSGVDAVSTKLTAQVAALNGLLPSPAHASTAAPAA